MSNPCLEAVHAEAEAFGLSVIREEYGGKHLKVFLPTADGEQYYVVPVSPSDRRAPLNVRRDVRNLLEQAGFTKPMTNNVRLSVKNGEAICNSLDVAANFGKAHKDVLRSIDRLTEEVGQEFTERNFAPSSYQDQSGRSLRCYDLTRDAFSLLVMGFTGAKATQWKLAYISAFNRMESELRKASGLPEEAAARLAKVEGDLQALIDLCFSQPQVPEGYVLIAAHVRKKRGTATGRNV